MTGEADDGTETRWLLEPPASGEVHVHLAVGSDVELSSEARAAMEALMEQLHDDEVMGFIPPCEGLSNCGGRYECTLGKCRPLVDYPCYAYVTCKVASFI